MNTLVVCQKCEKVNRVPLEKSLTAVPVCGSCGVELPFKEAVQEVDATTLDKLVRVSDRPIVVDFWASWCGPCQAFAPTFKAAARDLSTEFIFAKLDTEASPQAGTQYQIRGIPTLIVFKNGREVDRQSGAMPLPMLQEYLARWK